MKNILLIVAICIFFSEGRQPNILFVLTDDEDISLGTFGAHPGVQKQIVEQGVTFTNAFSTTPVCCPSRAALLTGRYAHNAGIRNNSVSGGCKTMFQREGETMGPRLTKLGYNTAFFGKYLNGYMDASHVPPGWDRWFGLIGNSVYYNYDVSDQGKSVHHGQKPADYLTNVINTQVNAWLQTALQDERPFFAYIAPPASHNPDTPFPTFQNNFTERVVPRTPNFNVHQPDKHWMVRVQYPVNESGVNLIDENYRNRMRTLLSVDVMVNNVFSLLQQANVLDNTYVVYASDHGYHLGHFSIPPEKRQPYEMDIRIPLAMRGPTIPKGKTVDNIALLIDLLPTFLSWAGENPPEDLDGADLSPTITSASVGLWRSDFLVEYWGEHGSDGIDQCYENIGDCWNNTFVALRTLSAVEDFTFVEFPLEDNFQEFYNMTTDKYQLRNAAKEMQPDFKEKVSERLSTLKACGGTSCKTVPK